ncbi:unnamed protein product [Amoebophrya sp. A25]|nr:unnamed protein product [Amoebophrya sp. A25]|eukprot:GSA25T00005454001.1
MSSKREAEDLLAGLSPEQKKRLIELATSSVADGGVMSTNTPGATSSTTIMENPLDQTISATQVDFGASSTQAQAVGVSSTQADVDVEEVLGGGEGGGEPLVEEVHEAVAVETVTPQLTAAEEAYRNRAKAVFPDVSMECNVMRFMIQTMDQSRADRQANGLRQWNEMEVAQDCIKKMLGYPHLQDSVHDKYDFCNDVRGELENGRVDELLELEICTEYDMKIWRKMVQGGTEKEWCDYMPSERAHLTKLMILSIFVRRHEEDILAHVGEDPQTRKHFVASVYMILFAGKPSFGDEHRSRCGNALRRTKFKGDGSKPLSWNFIAYLVMRICSTMEQKLVFSAYREVTWGRARTN